MLIRSQDQTVLINLDSVEVMHMNRVDDKYVIEFYLTEWINQSMGEYENQNQALKVLDKLQCFCAEPTYSAQITENETATYEDKVFDMPQVFEVSDVGFKL